MSDSPYDIYDRRMVDAMKAENDELRARVAELAAENARLCERIDRGRRAMAYEWKNDECEVIE